SNAPPNMKIEVEVGDFDELKQAVAAKVDIIMLDNMSPEEIVKAVKMVKKKALIEASGGIDLVNVVDVAKTGVDIVSIGALTHSARAVDIAMTLNS
ncbi:MAG: nicotinate-nucleotide diphosphorylase, partial [Thermodesulfobacteriota bacterium]